MKKIDTATFIQEFDDGGADFRDLLLTHCTFDNCGLSLTNKVSAMSTISNVVLESCRSMNSSVGPCILRDVIIKDLVIADNLIVWGALFERTTLSGKLGKLRINTAIQDTRATPAVQAQFDHHRARFYETVDWAIDISAARPLSLDLEGIPARLIRMDPTTQIALRRAELQTKDFQQLLRTLDADTQFKVSQLLESDGEDLLVAAPTGRAKKGYASVVASIGSIRKVGFGLP